MRKYNLVQYYTIIKYNILRNKMHPVRRKKSASYYKVVVIRVPLQGQNATIDKVLWIGLNLLPQDGFGKAPTTALCF